MCHGRRSWAPHPAGVACKPLHASAQLTPCPLHGPLPSFQVRASSPACRSTDPKALVGHNFARCNFAGPRLENGQLSRCARGRQGWWHGDEAAGWLAACSCHPPTRVCAPCFSTDSWWVLDLGPRHSLICNYYTLRHDASTDFLRSWVLQVGAAVVLLRMACRAQTFRR